MGSVSRFATVGACVALASTFAGAAFAQSNFAGVWVPNLFEDFPDRLPGPELGDYAGLPLNANDRLRAHGCRGALPDDPRAGKPVA